MTKYGFSIEQKGVHPSLIKQVHGNAVVESDFAQPDADGIVTHTPDKEIYVFTADCLSLLMQSPTTVAAIHAGWRGASLGIVKEALSKFSAPPEKVILGPCIRSCCFEVKEDFINTFTERRPEAARFLASRDGKTYFDLPSFVREVDLAALSDAQVDFTHNKCTVCDPAQLPSYRRNKGTDPRIRAWIRLSGTQK